MPTFPVRRLGASGVNTDTNPADLEDVGTFTAAVNARFKNGKVSRAPVYRTVAQLPHEPGHALSIPPNSAGYDEIVTVAHDFSTIYRLNGSSFEDLTPIGHTGASGTQVITSCSLGGLSYLNRESHAPLVKGPFDDTYATLPNWPSSGRCRVMRAYKDQLVALGVTKAGVYYPTMVKWSDFASFNAPPASWDETLTTNSAGENIVNEMQHEIVDGLTLRDSFILYCTGSVWTMDYIGGDFLYGFRKLFDESGVINPNCIVQVGGLHYVFDRNDIYVHDGVAPRSIADARTKDFIFDALDYSRAYLCFVTHDAKLTEIRFTYPADDRLVGFRDPETGCNRQAVFNYSNDTWTFYDVPNITGHCKSALISGDDWDTDPDTTFESAGGQWLSTEGDLDRHVLAVGRSDARMGLSAPRIYGVDAVTGGRLPLPAEPEALRPVFLERVGIDLDSAGKNLTQYVHLQTLWPQLRADVASDGYWQFGASDLMGLEPQWSDPLPFDPTVDTKIDINEAGKYMAFRYIHGGAGDFSLTGFDVGLVIRGRR